MHRLLIEYACPECGYDGPHTLFPAEDATEHTVAECGDAECGIEFDVPPDVAPVVPR